MNVLSILHFKSPLGWIAVKGNNLIHEVTFTASPSNNSKYISQEVSCCVLQLKEYFEGSRKEFTVKLLSEGTDFQKLVWKMLVQIPYGTYISYGELATWCGREKTDARAIGQANAYNKLLILRPCHRVVGQNNSLVGFAGGLERKAKLLALEKESMGYLKKFSPIEGAKNNQIEMF